MIKNNALMLKSDEKDLKFIYERIKSISMYGDKMGDKSIGSKKLDEIPYINATELQKYLNEYIKNNDVNTVRAAAQQIAAKSPLEVNWNTLYKIFMTKSGKIENPKFSTLIVLKIFLNMSIDEMINPEYLKVFGEQIKETILLDVKKPIVKIFPPAKDYSNEEIYRIITEAFKNNEN